MIAPPTPFAPPKHSEASAKTHREVARRLEETIRVMQGAVAYHSTAPPSGRPRSRRTASRSSALAAQKRAPTATERSTVLALQRSTPLRSKDFAGPLASS